MAKNRAVEKASLKPEQHPLTTDKFGDEISKHRLINSEQLKRIFPASTMTIWRMERAGKLPKHVQVGGKNYWPFHEVLEAIAALTEAAASSASGIDQT
jgi:predicted DNA-binding transcriptional regulator AlpA